MYNQYTNNVSFEDLIHDLKHHAKQFAQKMSEEFKGAGFDNCWNEAPNFDFDFDFDLKRFGYPRYDSFTKDDGTLVFRFLLPGFDESCIDLYFRGDMMILKARLPEELQNTERAGKRFVRDFGRKEYKVPSDLYNQGSAKATFKNGILTVSIPPVDDSLNAIKVEIIKEGN